MKQVLFIDKNRAYDLTQRDQSCFLNNTDHLVAVFYLQKFGNQKLCVLH